MLRKAQSLYLPEQQLHQSYAAMDGQTVTVAGWIKTSRDSKAVGFLSIGDGSCFTPLQIVYDADKLANFKEITKFGVGAAVVVTGKVVVTQAIAMDQNDYDTIEKLAAKGIKFDVRKVPADSPENFDSMMNKAKSELAAQA